ncbi:hypothetical protein Bpfe_025857 [Biomphalaria pfeifferi]|uniref:Uncharacterized protein n=1 Tax=Biomphalaria pfeifferi TaxID=112525 RepID=A0AAD8AYB7_BIOPF|nr:hypothetical protein Bpfe_025857 [Biomphalaria pfeifferi]
MFDNNNSSSECSPLYSEASYGNVPKHKSQKSTSHETSLQSSLKTKKKTCQGKRVAFTSDLSDKEIDPECHNDPTRNSEKVCPDLKNSYKYPAKKSSLVSKPKRIVGCVRFQDENSSISQNRKSLQQTTRRCLDPGVSLDEGSCLTNSEGLQTSSRNSTPRKTQLAGRPICREISKSGQWSHYDAGVYSWASQDDDKDDTRAETSSLVEGVDTSEDLERTGYSSISDWWTSDPLSNQEFNKLHSLDFEDSRRVQQSLSLAKTKSNSSRLQPSSNNGVKKGFPVEKVKVKCSGSGRESLHTPTAVTERAESKSKSVCNGKVAPCCLATRPARREVGSLSSAAASLAKSDAISASKRKERDSKCRPVGLSLRTRYSRSMADSRSNDPLVKFVERQHTHKQTRSLRRHSSLRLPATFSQQTNIHGDFVQHKINISLKKLSDDKLKGNPTQCEEKISIKSNAIDLPKHSMRLDPDLKHLLVYNAFTSNTPKEESARPADQALEQTNTIKPGSSIHVDLSRSLSGSVSESSIGIQCDILSPDSALSCNPLSPSSQHARRVASMYPAEDEVEATHSQHWASSGVDLSLDSEFVSCVSIGVQCEGSLFTSLLTLAWEDSTTAQVDSLALDQSNVFESQMKGSQYDNFKALSLLKSPLTNGLKTEHISRTVENCLLDPGNTSLQNTELTLEQVSRKLFQTNRTNGDQSLKQREIEMMPNSAEMLKTADDNSPQKRLITKSEEKKSQDGALLEHGRKSNKDHSEKNPDKNTTQSYKMRADSRGNNLQYESTIQGLVRTKEALSAQHSTLKDKVQANKLLQSNQQETELEQPQLAQQHGYTEQLLSAQRTMPAESLLSGQRTIPAEQLLSGQRTIPAEQLLLAQRTIPEEHLLSGHRTIPAEQLLSGQRTILAEQLLSGQRTIPAEQLLSGQRTIPLEHLLSGQRTILAEQLLSGQRTIPAEQLLSGQRMIPLEHLLSGQRTIPAEQLLSGQRTIPAEQLLSAQRTIPAEQLLLAQRTIPAEQLLSAQRTIPLEQLLSSQKQLPTEQLLSAQRQLPTEQLQSSQKHLPTEQLISTQKQLPTEQLLSAQKQLPTQQHSIRPENAQIDKDPSVLSESQTTYSGLSAEERTPGRSTVGDTLSKEQKINSNVYFNATDSRDSKLLRQENKATNSPTKSLRQENEPTNSQTKSLRQEKEATNSQTKSLRQENEATNLLTKLLPLENEATNWQLYGGENNLSSETFHQFANAMHDLGKEMRFSDLAIERNGVGSSPGRVVQLTAQPFSVSAEQRNLTLVDLPQEQDKLKQGNLTYRLSLSKQSDLTLATSKSKQTPMQEELSMQLPMQQEPSMQKPMYQEQSFQKLMQQEPSMQKPMQQEPSGQKPMQKGSSMQKPMQQEPSMEKLMQQEHSLQKPKQEEPSMQKLMQQEPSLQKPMLSKQSLPQQKYIPPEQSPTNQNDASPEQLKSTQFLPKGQAQSKQILMPAEESQLKEQFLKSEQSVSKRNRKLSKLELSESNQKILPSQQVQLKESEQVQLKQSEQVQLKKSEQFLHQQNVLPIYQTLQQQQLSESKQQNLLADLNSKSQFIPSEQLQSKQQFIPSEQLQSKQQFIPSDQLQSKQQFIPSEQLQSKQQFITSEQLQSKQQFIPSEQLQSKQQFIPSEQLQSKQQFIPSEQLQSKQQFIPSEQLQSKEQFITSEQLQSKQQFIPSEQLQSKQQFIPSEQLQSKQQFIPSEQLQSKQQFIPTERRQVNREEQLHSKKQFIPSEQLQSSKQQFIPSEQLQSSIQQFIPSEQLQSSKQQFIPSEQLQSSKQQFIPSEQLQSSKQQFIPSEQLQSKQQFIPTEKPPSNQQFMPTEQLQSKQQFIPPEKLQSKQQLIPSEKIKSKQQLIPPDQRQFNREEQLQSKQKFIPSEKLQSKQQFIPTEQLQSKLQFIPPEKLVSKHQFNPTEQLYLNQQLSPEMAQLNHQNVRSDQSQQIISSEQIQSNQKHLISSELHSSESAQSTKAQNQPRLAHQLTEEQKQPRLAHQLTEESSLKVRTQFNVGKPNSSMKVSLKPSFNPTALSNTSKVELRTLSSKDNIHLDNERTSRDLEKNMRSHSKTPDDTNKPSVFSNDTFEVNKAFPLLDSRAEAGKTIGGLISKKTSSMLDRTQVSANATRATANNIPIVQVTLMDDQIMEGNKSISTDNEVPLGVSFNPMSKLEVTNIKEHNSSLLLSKGEKRACDPKYRIPPGAEEWYRNNRLLSMEIVLGPQPVFDLKPPASVKSNTLLTTNKEALTSNLKGKISLTKNNTTLVTNEKANKSFPKSFPPREAIIASTRNSIESDLPFKVFVDNKTKLTSDRVRNSTSSDKPIYREDNQKQDTPDKTKTAIYNIFGRRKSFNTPDVKKIPADDPKYSSVNVVPKNQPIERKPQKLRKNTASKYFEQTRSKSNMSPLLKILQNSSKPFLKSDRESDALFNWDMTTTLKTFKRKGKPGKDRSEDNIIENLQESNKNALSNSPSTSSDNSRENRHYVSTYLSEKSENLDTSINTELSSKSGDHGQPIGASSYQNSGSEKAQTHLSGLIEEDKSKVIRGHHNDHNSLNSKNTVISLELTTTLNEMHSRTEEDAGFPNDSVSVKAKLYPYLNPGSLISPNTGTLGYDEQLNVAFESSVDPEMTQHPNIDVGQVESATTNLFSTPDQDIIKVYGSSVDLDYLPENDIASSMDSLDHNKQWLPTVTAESGETNDGDRSTIVIASHLNEKHSPTVETNQKGDNLSLNDVFDTRSSETSHKPIYLTDNIGAKLFMEIPQRDELYSEMIDSNGESIQETSSIESLEIAAALASSTDAIFPVQPETVVENRLTEQQREHQPFLKSRNNGGSWFKNNDDSGIGSLKSPIFKQDRQRESVRKRPKLAPQLPTFSSFIDKRKCGYSSLGQRKKKEPPKAKPRVVSECFYYSDLNMMQLTLKPVNWPNKSHESPGDLSTHAININFHTSPIKKPSSTLVYSRARSQSTKRSVNV